MATFGRQLQVVGLVVLPLAMLLQLFEKLTVGQMIIMAVMGGSAFWIGRIVEGYTRQ